MKLQAPTGCVLVILDAENQSSQLVIPEKYKKFSDRGTVVSVGGGRRHIDGKIYPIDLKTGDRVVVATNGAYRMEHEGAKYVSIPAESIVAIMLDGDSNN